MTSRAVKRLVATHSPSNNMVPEWLIQLHSLEAGIMATLHSINISSSVTRQALNCITADTSHLDTSVGQWQPTMSQIIGLVSLWRQEGVSQLYIGLRKHDLPWDPCWPCLWLVIQVLSISKLSLLVEYTLQMDTFIGCAWTVSCQMTQLHSWMLPLTKYVGNVSCSF